MTTYYVDPEAAGSNNGTDWTNAWTSLQSAADGISAGDVVYCRGTQTVTAAIDFDTAGATGTWAAPIKFIGCNASGNVDGTRFILDANSNACACAYLAGAQDYLWFVNFQFQNSGNSSGLLVGSSYVDSVVFVNCRFTGNNQYGAYLNQYCRNTTFKQCIFDSNASGIYKINGSFLYGCSFSDNSSYGIYSNYGATVFACTFHDNGVMPIYFGAGGATILNSVIDTAATAGADGLVCVGTSPYFIVGLRVTNINDKEIDLQANVLAILDYVYTDGVITETSTAWRIPDKTNTAHIVESGSDANDGYVTDELNLASGATYRSDAIEIPSS